jgi:hypothetical protein
MSATFQENTLCSSLFKFVAYCFLYMYLTSVFLFCFCRKQSRWLNSISCFSKWCLVFCPLI